MKKIFLLLTIFVFILSSCADYDNITYTSSYSDSPIDKSAYDYYYEFVDLDSKYISDYTYEQNLIAPIIFEKTKTTHCKDSSGNILWSLSVTATFLYHETVPYCIDCSASATINNSDWSYENLVSSYSGDSATVSATFVQQLSFGRTKSYEKSVTITCTPDGIVH